MIIGLTNKTLGSSNINVIQLTYIHWDHPTQIQIWILIDLGLRFRALDLATNFKSNLFLLRIKNFRHSFQ